jgi:acetolactate synthase-1/2/3 large subunit
MPDKPLMYKVNPIRKNSTDCDYEHLHIALKNSKRPLVLAGYGIRRSNNVGNFVRFINKYQIPFVSTYGARDYTPNDDRLSIGTVGQRGSRAGNFALQNADLLIILGSTLNASVIGYDPKQFSPKSYKIQVDIDRDETKKDIVKIDKIYVDDLTFFFEEMI